MQSVREPWIAQVYDRLHATDYDKAMKDFVARQPMGRIAETSEIATGSLSCKR